MGWVKKKMDKKINHIDTWINTFQRTAANFRKDIWKRFLNAFKFLFYHQFFTIYVSLDITLHKMLKALLHN